MYFYKGAMGREQIQDLLEEGSNWLRKSGIKSLYNVLDNIDLDDGVRVMDSCGHGILKPNIVVVGYKNDWFNCEDEYVQTYLNILKYSLFFFFYIYCFSETICD